MKILIIEDDNLQSDFFIQTLEEIFSDLEIIVIGSESQFLISVAELETEPPDLIITDVMLRWGDPTPNLQLLAQKPKEIEKEGSYRAGFRCIKLLQSKETLAKIPVIIYSVLERESVADFLSEMPEHIVYFTKDFNANKLEKQIRSLIITENNLPPNKEKGLFKKAIDATDAKPGSMGFSFDLKKFFKRNKK